MNLFCSTQYFHSMGDGLFCSGRLHCREDTVPPFLWIFDCGTLDGEETLGRELRRFESAFARQPVNLVSLSHFDKDHVLGAEKLLSQYYVDVIVLPYLSICERMLVAVNIKDPDPEYLRFLIDPASYLTQLSLNVNLRVVLIRGGSPPDSDVTNDHGINPSGDDHRSTGLIVPPGEAYDDQDPTGILNRTNVSVVSHHRPFRVGNEWEFMYYNENREHHLLESLRDLVRDAIRTARQSDGSYNGTNLVSQLKQIYNKKFGRASSQKNRISLAKYSGPAYWRRRIGVVGATWTQHIDEEFSPAAYRGYPAIAAVQSVSLKKPSALLTGDIYFNTITRIEAARRHFGEERWNSVGILQVPHHGSRHSWFIGAASVFNHEVSVFSARSGKAARPHAHVLADLNQTSLRFANEYQGIGSHQVVRYG